MALSQSPRKVVPLASGDDYPPRPKARSTGANVTRRVFLCGVVVEGADSGRELSQDVQDLVASLGEPMDLESEPLSPSSAREHANLTNIGNRVPATTNADSLNEVVKELVSTERSYVKRLRILKTDYADPLRSFARNKDTAIIPPYEAKTLFGNIDHLLPVNEAFLTDLEKMEKMALKGGLGVGDVALKHFKTLRGFEHYRQYYAKREEAQRIFEHEVKRSSRFSEYIDRVKYSTADMRNKVGLRELLMEPVQRIPRYTLMFRTMLKHMGASDPQRAPLQEADDIASRIALAETDDQTKRAATLYSLASTVDDFPVALVSNSRQFLACIDVQDVIAPDPFMAVSSNGPAAALVLHCTLFLFDDKLVIVKRPAEKGGRTLAGLDQPDRPTKVAGGKSAKKTGLVCKGVIDITDIVATDVGGADFHMYLENPPTDVSERWAARQFRSLSVVFPPSPVYLDPQRTESEKHRFLEQLWDAQARFRTRAGRSVVLRGDEREVENRGGRVTMARPYFNVYTRTSFLQEPKKTKIVMHVDPMGVADAISFGSHAPPYVVVRVQPMAGELARYKVTSSDPDDEPEEDIMQTSRIPERIVQTIHQYGLFKFSTGNVSRPTTPTASRSRTAMFGLDVISRNLFGTRPGSGMGDFFAGSMNGHRRSRTANADSRTSTLTSNGGSSIGRFSRTSSNSATTAGTSLHEDDGSPPASGGSFSKSTSSGGRARSLSRGAKKLVKRAKSPFAADVASEPESPARPKETAKGKGKDSYSRRRSMSTSQADVLQAEAAAAEQEDQSEWEAEGPDSPRPSRMRRVKQMDASERDLTMRLELARRNSQNQHGRELSTPGSEPPSEETIYEADEPPPSFRPLSRASRASRSLPEIPQDVESLRSGTPTLRAPSPLPSRPTSPDSRTGRSLSRNSSDRSDRKPMGPRSPSPLPRSPTMLPISLSSVNLELETTLVNAASPTTPSRPLPSTTTTPIPRSKRQPFEPVRSMNHEVTPRAAERAEEPTKPKSIAPLSVTKKSSVRSNASVLSAGSPGSARKNSASRRVSPLGKGAFANGSPRRVSNQRERAPKLPSLLESLDAATEAMDTHEVDRLVRLAETTKQDIDSSRRAIKRIRFETEKITAASPVRSAVAEWESRPVSPTKPLRTPQRVTPPAAASPALTREALARREEMMQAIGRRMDGSGGTPRARPRTLVESSSSSSSLGAGSSSSPKAQEVARSIEDIAIEADGKLAQALRTQEEVASGMKNLLTQLQEKSTALTAANIELANVKMQRDVFSDLIKDKNAEVDVLYESFNEELQGMYDDATLPEDEAWAAMTRDLKAAKRSEKAVRHENHQLKRRINELETQQEQWAHILRSHGLIP
ncbi:uncharacterized protein TRAVEDRAFT_162896 [Trametes versicolor FP-101664 SS1]|uniref:uncharacterized protein n=1 Tax=Trametes versicolor (strain FP-101664) TaxID=717944 RepID=UPI0004623125|nr:uncharacterized protein TRAVEDRAFT_162896 [Trametes versicolor FP-101664 SS1]EIW61568.1 hypothetical protein TRAVEDRAFT_162896 [Trametes versicolor FP-101664 SS1]